MSSDLLAMFLAVNRVLQQYQHYWRHVAFSCQDFPWQNSALNEFLWQLPDAQINEIDQSAILQRQYFSAFFPELFEILVPEMISGTGLPVPFWLSKGIGGRKLEQIDAFFQVLPSTTMPVLEWCAGKGHLGRLLSFQRGNSVVSVEFQSQLCTDGQQLADKYQLPQTMIQADVLQSGSDLLLPQQQVLALHACGQLHVHLLQQASHHRCQQLHVVPCCYHLIPEQVYQPLSDIALQQNLYLQQHELKLAVQGQITAGARVEKLRETEVSWRLAYQLLRADVTGDAVYKPFKSVSKHWFSGEFVDFAHWAAAEQALVLPAMVDWQHYLQRGAEYMRLTKRIELIRHLFRRPLELWLVLDRALFLQQAGYQVSVKQFCDDQVTPRNLIIQAELLFE